MIPVLSRAEMRAFDKCAIEMCQVPGVVLMENAGRGAADVLSAMIEADGCGRARPARDSFPTRHVRAPGQPARYPLHARVVVVCGTGNNGGDGFVVARHLLARGADVTVVLTGRSEKVTGDARINHDAYVDLGGLCVELPEGAPLERLTAEIAEADYVIDAIFGTGLDRPIVGHLVEVIHAVNQAKVRKIALDIPSGLDADSGSPLGIAVHADDTVTFGHLKIGLLTPEGARLAGNVHVVDLGVPDAKILEQVGHVAEVIAEDEIGAHFLPREANVHKHAAGNVLVVAGSEGKLGAAVLTGRAAMRGGAGLVTVATWPDASRALAALATEVMTTSIDASRLDDALRVALEGRHVVAIGPGLGLDDAARRAVDHVVLGWEGTKIVDADAITHFTGRAKELAGAKGRLVLTPHPGELGRLLGRSGRDVEQDRFGAVREAVALTRATVVLKGARTIIATPDGRLFISMAGNPALATAGSGDVLTGLIAAFACTLPVTEAACAGVLVHAKAGDRWRERTGADRGLLASELCDAVPELVAALWRSSGSDGRRSR